MLAIGFGTRCREPYRNVFERTLEDISFLRLEAGLSRVFNAGNSGLERLMSVELQRLNTSKVANVGVKAKVWPDEQHLCVVWLSGAEVVGSGKNRCREEGGGKCIGLYFERDPDQDHACTSKEAA